jgi:hypothetical protein
MADSQSFTPSISSAPPLNLPQPPPASVAPHELVWKHQQFRLIEHRPSKRRGLEQSEIWNHGTDYECVDDAALHGWRCHYCFKNYVVVMKQGADVTTNAHRHLRNAHSMNLDSVRSRKRKREDIEEEDKAIVTGPQVKGLMTIINVNEFRYRLTRWMINRHIAFSEVENSDFQDMLKSINGSINDYLVRSGNTIRNWVEDDFLEAKRLVQDEVLARALSKIHVSCDLWTSPNGYAMCGVAAHFIGHQGYVQTILLALRRMMGAHGGEQIAEIIIEVILEYGFSKRLGCYVGDNADSNDTAWKTVLSVLHPDRDPVTSRSRCLGHIINLAAKAFIFGDNVGAFESVVDAVNDATPQDSPAMRAAQNEWRKKGALGKLHNVVVFIRVSPQRREAFKRITVDELSDRKFISPLRVRNFFGGVELSLANIARLQLNEAS